MRSTIRTLTLAVVAWLLAAAVPATASAIVLTPDTVGTVDPSTGIWSLRDEAGDTFTFYYGNPGDFAFAGDWNCDGIDTPGLYRRSDGFVYLRNSNTQGVADITFFFGNPGDIPIAGDFDNDGCDTVSVYRPSQGRVFIINELGENGGQLGVAEQDYYFGNPGDTPFTGDFDGDGVDTIGLYRQSTGQMYFRNSHTQGIADQHFYYGNPGDRFVAGDWNANNIDSPGVFRPSQARFYLKYENQQGNADESFAYGKSSSIPVAGTWGDIPAIPGIALQQVASGMNQPIAAAAPPGDDRLFIAQRGGSIWVLESGSIKATPFLSVPGVSTCGEGGLLGLAFHPDYAANGRFFVHYTAPNGGSLQSRIVEYHANTGSDVADANPVRTILTLNQPACNHNAGGINFGPDGYLYIPFGDGGNQNDPDENAQNPFTWLGSVLRIDIDGTPPYTIPPGNPYNGANGLREIWAIGLRNPFRSSFDTATGDLYIGDVGQGAWEEIDVLPAGSAKRNFGWDIREGNACHEPSSGCTSAGLTPPVVVYPNPASGPSAVTGGAVYRGDVMPNLRGTYFYADFYDGWIRSFRLVGGAALDQRDWESKIGSVSNIVAFATDGHGEMYVVSLAGRVYKIVPG
jgi:glucose/arabinose dehydrogenase